jgi:hypothetical protein
MRTRASDPGVGLSAILLAVALVYPWLRPTPVLATDFGRLSGTISDNRGDPLMGATVLIIGPMLIPSAGAGDQAERVITDARGKFSAGHLVPGWYSLQIISPTRLTARRNGIKVQAGETSTLRFVLGDMFAPLRFQISDKGATSMGEDWKWVLRTSAATRPILRYLPATPETAANAAEPRLPASQRLLGMAPGAASRDPIALDPGMTSVLAYLRPLSQDADLLVLSSVAANGSLTSAMGTEYRKGLANGEPEEISLVVHQLGYPGGMPNLGGGQFYNFYPRGLVASYTGTHYIWPRLTLTAGLDVDYLDALRAVMTTQPRMRLLYHLSDVTDVAFQVGARPSEGLDPLMERIGALSSFPLVTLRGYRPELEQINHAEISLSRRLNGPARLELAVYHDSIKNAAVWGTAHLPAISWLAGNYLVDPAVGGILVNVGDYNSSGYRAAYERRFGNHLETLLAYQVGDCLYAHGVVSLPRKGDLQGVLKPVRSESFAGRVSARVPGSRTQLITSYEWVQRGRVTTVDPFGQADMQLQPYFDVQVRQPIPALAFLPSHIEAVADFRNFLAQGNSAFALSGETALQLSSAYKSVRGGFSVEF